MRGTPQTAINITNHIIYPLFFFLEINIKPMTAKNTKAIQPDAIKISCGNSPFNIPIIKQATQAAKRLSKLPRERLPSVY